MESETSKISKIGLHVFKLKNTASQIYHKLAFVEPSGQDGLSDVYYDDADYLRWPARLLPIRLAARRERI